jgi:hypothetical protein
LTLWQRRQLLQWALGVGCSDWLQEQMACSMVLLLDFEGELAAAVLEPRAATVLPPTLQKFYNPMHYQQVPNSE